MGWWVVVQVSGVAMCWKAQVFDWSHQAAFADPPGRRTLPFAWSRSDFWTVRCDLLGRLQIGRCVWKIGSCGL